MSQLTELRAKSRRNAGRYVTSCLLGLLLLPGTWPMAHSSAACGNPAFHLDGQMPGRGAWPQQAPTLEPGAPISRELSGGQNHTYRLALAAGQYLHVEVEQQGVDVAVVILGPGGQTLIAVDYASGAQGPEPLWLLDIRAQGWTGRPALSGSESAGNARAGDCRASRSRLWGPEPVWFVTEAEGDYRLVVSAAERMAAPGGYTIKLVERRSATPRDRRRMAAQQAFLAGERMKARGEASAWLNAIENYQAALSHWRAAGGGREEAATLSALGQVYDSLGEKQQALGYYQQALPRWLTLGGRRAEAIILNNLGVIYDSLGEKQQAVDYLQRAISLLKREAGDCASEAAALNNLGRVYDSLGAKQRALDHFGQALRLARAATDRRGEAITLNNLSAVYNSLGEARHAMVYLDQAKRLVEREAPDRRVQAATFNHLGLTHDSLGQKQQALDYLRRTLALHLEPSPYPTP